MRKSKAKYDSLAEDYDRARTGDRQATKKFGLKGPKSAAQHEEELLRKVQAADADYQSKVQAAQATRQELLNRARPETVKNLQDMIKECDSALALQMQKFGMHILPRTRNIANLEQPHSARSSYSATACPSAHSRATTPQNPAAAFAKPSQTSTTKVTLTTTSHRTPRKLFQNRSRATSNIRLSARQVPRSHNSRQCANLSRPRI